MYDRMAAPKGISRVQVVERPTGAVSAAGWGRVGPARWSRADLLVAGGLALLTALSRWPFRTTMLQSWDAGLFAQALDDYNVVAHHPQPPGYIFYVAVAKALRALTGLGANATYVLISLGAASLTVALLYGLGRLLFDRPTGLLAAGLAATSVSFWYYSAIVYPYTTLALGSTALALLCRLLATGRVRPPLAGLAFGLTGGFRQDLLLFLANLAGG
ncbi:MAG: glycosyltransferase family 39 protein [Chloroflexota bacterium]|nr:glycosyltransferase family 39 protein [Chloroflexota bacterium]